MMAKVARACEAAGCTAALAGNDYYSRRGLCAVHAKADAMCRRGHGSALFRWCQQCGRLEPLAAFEGVKRSCRASLERRRAHARSMPLPKCQLLGAPGAASPSRDSADAPASLALNEAPHAAAAAAWQQPGTAAVDGRVVLVSPAGGSHVSGAAPPSSFGASAGAGVALQPAAGAWAEPAAALLGAGQGWLQHATPLAGGSTMQPLAVGAVAPSSQPVCMLSAAEVEELVEHLLGEQAHEPHEPQLPAPSFGAGSGDSTGGSAAPVLAAAAVAAQVEATLEHELHAAATAARAPVGGTSSPHSSSTVGALPAPPCALAAAQWPAAGAAGAGLQGVITAPVAGWLDSGRAFVAPAAAAGYCAESVNFRARLQALQVQLCHARAALQQLRAEYASLEG